MTNLSQVRVDSRSKVPLGNSDRSNCLYWCRIQRHLSELHKLPGRRFAGRTWRCEAGMSSDSDQQVDTYSLYAASAVSANTFLRSLFASGLPLAARPMFHRMGVGPACSVLGGVACLALPVPFIFMKYGLRLRKMSKFAPVPED